MAPVILRFWCLFCCLQTPKSNCVKYLTNGHQSAGLARSGLVGAEFTSSQSSEGAPTSKRSFSPVFKLPQMPFSIIKVYIFSIENTAFYPWTWNFWTAHWTGAGSDLFTPFLKNLSASTFPLVPINRVRRRPGTFQGGAALLSMHHPFIAIIIIIDRIVIIDSIVISVMIIISVMIVMIVIYRFIKKCKNCECWV